MRRGAVGVAGVVAMAAAIALASVAAAEPSETASSSVSPSSSSAGPASRSEGARSVSSVLAPDEWAQVFVVPKHVAGPRVLWRALVAAGADGVFLRAFHLRGDRPHEEAVLIEPEGAYFPARGVPLVEDRLAEDCAGARAAGLRCWAWMTTRDTPMPNVGRHHRDVAWDPASGEFVPRDGLDPFDEAAVRALERVFEDLARTGVDGVLLQDDFAMRHLEGFSLDARRAWRDETGRRLDPAAFYELVPVPRKQGDGEKGSDPFSVRVTYKPAFWEFARFKTRRLLDVAERLRDAGRRVNPDFELGLNLYYETALNPRFGVAWLSQDLEEAAARDFRWLAVMAYHRQVADELSLDERQLDEAMAKMAQRLAEVPDARRRVLVKLQGIDWRNRDPVPPPELAGVARHFAPFARALVPADTIGRSGEQLEAIRRRR